MSELETVSADDRCGCVVLPRSFEDFLALNGQTEWPQGSENVSDVSNEIKEFSSPDDIRKLFGATVLVTDGALASISKQLAEFELKLHAVADKLLNVTGPEERQGTTGSQPVSYRGQSGTPKAIEYEPKDSPKDVVNQLMELESRSVERFRFPGFRRKHLTALPGNIEALTVLYDVLMDQPILPNTKLLWKKIFLSEASVGMLHDGFWWTFIDKFQCDRVIERSRLFDRLADTFVALLYSISPDIKDKVLMTYSDCLAQSIYAVYSRTFPASAHHFNDSFKQYLINTSYEWISGIRPSAGLWLKWNVASLERRQLATDSEVAKLSAVAHGNKPQSLDIEGLQASIQSIGDTSGDPVSHRMSRSASRSLSLSAGAEPSVEVENIDPVTRLWKNKDSHVVGRGAELERVLFNMNGRSVLASHFMRCRQIHAENAGERLIILRTQITQLPASDALTYRDVAHSVWQKHEQRRERYKLRLSRAAANLKSIVDADKRQSEVDRRISQLASQFPQSQLQLSDTDTDTDTDSDGRQQTV